jgi:DNA-binding NarL/FixJ family response regulator
MEEETPGRREGEYFDGFEWKKVGEETETEAVKPTDGSYELSPREKEIVKMMSGGMTAKQMAQSLLISHRTVQFHMDAMYWKLGCSGRGARVQAVQKARKLGYIK